MSMGGKKTFHAKNTHATNFTVQQVDTKRCRSSSLTSSGPPLEVDAIDAAEPVCFRACWKFRKKKKKTKKHSRTCTRKHTQSIYTQEHTRHKQTKTKNRRDETRYETRREQPDVNGVYSCLKPVQSLTSPLHELREKMKPILLLRT